jgi:hypothetical protein
VCMNKKTTYNINRGRYGVLADLYYLSMEGFDQK